MSIRLEDEVWNLTLEDSSYVEYDNYVVGFKPIQLSSDLVVNTVRVFIAKDKPKGEVVIFCYPWKAGEILPDDVPDTIYSDIVTVVKESECYQKLISYKG